ncbi:MAG: hypothetical protein ACI845_002960 [Gammaproteobacteria bacterium]|jgi:hypothetical protein
MFQSRDEIRQVYLDVWQKMQTGDLLETMESVIADVIQMHPEYHELFTNPESAKEQEFTPEAGKTNPFLHMGMHIAIREQVSIDKPAGIKQKYETLLGKRNKHQAEHNMLECLGQGLWLSQRNNVPFDEQAYLNCVGKL